MQSAKLYIVNSMEGYKMCIPLAGRETILKTLALLIRPLLALTQMVYFVLHWRLGKVALVAVVLPTVYIIREPPSGW